MLFLVKADGKRGDGRRVFLGSRDNTIVPVQPLREPIGI